MIDFHEATEMVDRLEIQRVLGQIIEGSKKKIRAIYAWDIRFDNLEVFEYDRETKYFVSLTDNEICYSIEDIIADEDWLVYEIDMPGRGGTINKIR